MESRVNLQHVQSYMATVRIITTDKPWFNLVGVGGGEGGGVGV